MAGRGRPVGTITRGTTNPNRLRRCDRWIAGPEAWRLRRSPTAPVVVDLGYGASPITAVELHDRLRRVRADVQVVGVEIDPERVTAGRPLEREGLTFRLGGFEVPLDDGARPTVVRAFNVLRQYPEEEVPAAWARVQGRLAPGGLLDTHPEHANVRQGTPGGMTRTLLHVLTDRPGHHPAGAQDHPRSPSSKDDGSVEAGKRARLN